MQTDVPPRKPGGRLSREDQRRLGDILKRMYDDVVHQGVPDRFRDLLTELEGEAESARPVADGPREPQESQSESDRLMGASGLHNPDVKGRH